MPRKTEFVKRKGKDKAKEHRQKCGKYDGKATRRALNHMVKVPVKLNPFSYRSAPLITRCRTDMLKYLETLIWFG